MASYVSRVNDSGSVSTVPSTTPEEQMGNFPERLLRYGRNIVRRNTIVEEFETIQRKRMFASATLAVEVEEVRPWLENVQRRGTFGSRRGRVLREVIMPESYKGLRSAKFSPDGKHIAMAFGAGAIVLVNPATGEQTATVRGVIQQHIFPVTCVRFSSDRSDRFFAGASSGYIYICQLRTGRYEIHAYEANNEINSIDINNDSSNLASGGKDAVIRVYDLITAKMVTSYPNAKMSRDNMFIYHNMRIFATKFHPLHKNLLLSGGWDDLVKIWDIRTADGLVREIRGPHICGEAIDIRDKEVLTGSWTVANSIQLWDFGSGKLIACVTPYNRPQTIDGEFIYCLQYMPSDSTGDTIVCGGSGTDLAEVISLSEKKVLANYRVNKTVMALAAYQNWLVIGGMDRTVKIVEYCGRNPAAMRKTLV